MSRLCHLATEILALLLLLLSELPWVIKQGHHVVAICNLLLTYHCLFYYYY